MALKQLFFQKIIKNRPTAGGFAPGPQSLRPLRAPPPDLLSVIRLSYTGFLKTSPLQSYIFALFNYISLSSLPLQNPG